MTRGNIPSTVVSLACIVRKGDPLSMACNTWLPEFLQGMKFSAWWGKRLTMSLGAKKGWLFESLVSNFERYTWT